MLKYEVCQLALGLFEVSIVGAVGDYARGQCSADTGAMSWHAVLQFRGQREWYATRHLSEPAPNAQGLGPRSRVG